MFLNLIDFTLMFAFFGITSSVMHNWLFTQADEELSVAHWIMESHKGTIQVTNNDPKETRFISEILTI